MRVGIDISQIVYQTGVSDYTVNLVSELIKLIPSDQLVLFGSSLRKKDTIRSQFPQTNLYSFPPTLLHYLWNKLHILNVENFLGEISVFHSSDWTEPPASCPKVTTIHDLSPLIFPNEMSAVSGVHKAKLYWSSRECKKIICVSESTASDAARLLKIPSNKIVVIPEALPARFNIGPDPEMVQSQKQKYNLSSYLIAIGTRQPRKNLTKLISAYIRYKKQYHLPEKLVIVGGSGWGSNNEKYSSDIIFTGYLPDTELVALLSAASVFVYPSLYEGFGLPILNAFRQSIPVVTSNISSMPEVVGNAGILVDPLSDESIADGIRMALLHRKDLISKGKKRLSTYSWAETARKTLDVYKSLC